MTIQEIKQRNKEAGRYFFEPAAMRFFQSKIGRKVYQGPGGVYFVTSEQFIGSDGRAAPRKYTVRKFDPATGEIDTVGKHNELSNAAAVNMAKRLASGTD